MFYLVAFLSLLISLLIYMMDPAPTNLRQDSDIRGAEAYIGGFLNQHQAARDFLKYWLGRVNPDTNVVGTYNGTIVGPGTAGSTGDASVIALPGGIDSSSANSIIGQDNFMPNRQLSERYVDDNGVDSNKGYLKHDGNDDNNRCATGCTNLACLNKCRYKGSYFSALVCLDAHENLTPCYDYEVMTNGTQIVSQVAAPAMANVVRTHFAAGVEKAYVITYSLGAEIPKWWEMKGALYDNHGNKTGGGPKALRLELWRLALARRAHASYNCGVLYKPDSIGGVAFDASQPGRYGWRYNRNTIYNRVVSEQVVAGEKYYNYCLDAGKKCVNVLPTGIETFLKAAIGDDLNETFFCMSPVNDPYEHIMPSVYHFDGVDILGLGAQKGDSNSDRQYMREWWPQGSGAGANIGGLARPYPGSAYYVTPGGAPSGADLEFGASGIGVKISTGTTTRLLRMPFTYSTNDFTLSVVFNVSTQGAVNGWILGKGNHGNQELDEGVYYGLYANGNNLIFYPNDNRDIAYGVPPIQIDDVFGNGGVLEEGRHQLVIMRRDNQMYVIFDNKSICAVTPIANGTPVWTAEPAAGVPAATAVTFGDIASDAIQILDVRYYDHALMGKVLKKLFKVDMMRYDVRPLRRQEFCEIPDGWVIF